MKKILILHTGGTFGMSFQENHSEIQNSKNLLDDLLQHAPEISRLASIQMEVLCNIDSSNGTPDVWIQIAKSIHKNWNLFHGFVVIHGTDTMAWCTSALAFFLEKLTKPVIFTGSQRPINALRNDARANIIDAVELATHDIPEVLLCFDSKVHRATRVTKYSNEHLHAFRSYNSPLMGQFGVHLSLNRKLTKFKTNPSKQPPPNLNINIDSNITSLLCVPGVVLNPKLTEGILETSSGIIIKGFGSGNLPTKNNSWLSLCENAFLKKIPVVMTSQCDSGSINLNSYDNGKVYANLGVISALDMTFESASVKLMVMLGRKIAFEHRHAFFSTPLAFECTLKN